MVNSSPSRDSPTKNFNCQNISELFIIRDILYNKQERKGLLSETTVQPFLKPLNKQSKEHIPWEYVLNKKQQDMISLLLQEEISSTISPIEANYFNNLLLPSIRKINKHILPVKINQDKLSSYISKEIPLKSSQSWSLKSFFPQRKTSMTYQQSLYDFSRTETGRLLINSGPEILTLKKEYRDIIQSVFDSNGLIVSLDFSSLEPRVAINSNTNSDSIAISESDVYSLINKQFFNNSISDRYILKELVSSYIHGYGIQSVQSVLLKNNLYPKSVQTQASTPRLPPQGGHMGFDVQISAYLEGLFGRERFMTSLNSSNSSRKHFLNYFGRRLFHSKRLDYSHYIQSTGSDLSIFVFSDILEQVQTSFDGLVRPIFLIHDAIMLDVCSDVISESDILNFVSRIESGIGQKYFSGSELRIPFRLSLGF